MVPCQANNDKTSGSTMKRHQAPWTYWPNIIDYARLALFILFTLTAFHHYTIAVSAFIILALSDAADGFVARLFKQQSKLGTALDFTIDRVVTACLLLILAMLYPSCWLGFAGFLVLDCGSHFMHLYATACVGDHHHKHSHHITNPLLKLYYNNRHTLFALCFCHDAWLIGLYWYHFSPTSWLLWVLALLTPGFVIKTLIHGLQAYSAARYLNNSEQA